MLFRHSGIDSFYGDTWFSGTAKTYVSIGFNFLYFNMPITSVSMYKDARVDLFTPGRLNRYSLGVYYINAGYAGPFMYRSERNTNYLYELSILIRQATGSIFTAQNAFVVTYYRDQNPVSTSLYNSFQLVLVTDGRFSFLVFNYERLDNPVGSSYYDNVNTTRNFVNGTVTGSNCNLPGQYVYRVDGCKISFFIYLVIKKL
jgi:hypothetical protein